jgi:hypothetical protein
MADVPFTAATAGLALYWFLFAISLLDRIVRALQRAALDNREDE